MALPLRIPADGAEDALDRRPAYDLARPRFKVFGSYSIR
jgi:hypothetical protein